MDTALGLLGITIFVACVIALAAGLTWLVVKIDRAVRSYRQAQAPTPSQ